MRRLLMLLGLAAASTGAAQTTTNTRCERTDRDRVECQSETRETAAARNRRETDDYIARSRARRDALMTDLRASRDRQAASTARIAEIERQTAAADAAHEVRTAQFQIFIAKANHQREAALKALGIFGDEADKYWREAGQVLLTLFTANPLASTTDIQESLAPIRDSYKARVDAFYDRLIDVTEAYITLYGIGAVDRERFESEVMRATLDLPDRNLDTPAREIERVVLPVASAFVKTSPRPVRRAPARKTP